MMPQASKMTSKMEPTIIRIPTLVKKLIFATPLSKSFFVEHQTRHNLTENHIGTREQTPKHTSIFGQGALQVAK